MKTLEDLFKYQIQNLFSAETQLTIALPKMINAINDKKLTKIIEIHLENTKKQKSRLEVICREINISPSGKKCLAVKGIIKEIKNFIRLAANNEVLDAELIAITQSIIHYKISRYGTTVRFTKELGLLEISEKLQETLNEEYNINITLNEIAENKVNKEAIN